MQAFDNGRPDIKERIPVGYLCLAAEHQTLAFQSTVDVRRISFQGTVGGG
jgi:hypothetical protein